MNGSRGDGDFVPDAASPLGKQLDAVRDNPKLNPDGKPLEGIPYANGFPKYDDFVVPAGGGKAQVEIIQAGNHSTDFTADDDALFKSTGKTKDDLEAELGVPLTWHHKEDGVTMQLVPAKIHGARSGTGHAGGASLEGKEEF